MTTIILDATTRAAVRDATSQQAQLEALIAPWSAGQVTLRYYSAADALLVTCTHAAWAINTSTTPRQVAVGALVSESGRVAGPTAASYVIAAVPGGADILRADVSLAASVGTATGRVNLAPQTGGAGLVVTADAGLPAAPTPTWASGAAVNEWVAITGTSGAGGADVDAFSGWALKTDTSDLYVLAAGGHTNGGDNRVVRLRLTDNAPAWTQRRASDWNGSEVNVSHYASGSPAARHTYHTTQWVPSIGRFLLVGAAYVKGGPGDSFPAVDGYDPETEAWDAAGTYTEVLRVAGPGTAYGFGVATDGDGKIWADHNRRYDPTTDTWDAPAITGVIGGRFPQCYCPTLGVMFGLQWGDGQGGGTGIAAYKRVMSTLTDSTITFSAGSAAAAAQFASDTPFYAGMDWDAANGRFLFYAGGSRVYAITPNSGTEWDMAILTTTGTPPGAAAAGGINSKWTYVAALGEVSGFVGMPASSGNVFFLRVA